MTIRYSAHGQLLNSRALEAVGIGRDTPSQAELDAVAPGARIRRDPASGEPTGVVNECVDWVLGRHNPWPYGALKDAIVATLVGGEVVHATDPS